MTNPIVKKTQAFKFSSRPNVDIMLVFPERPQNNGGCTGVLDAYSMLESFPKPRRLALEPWMLALRLCSSSWNHGGSSRARICRSFKETRNRFPAWRAGTTTLFFVPAVSLHRLAKSIPRNRFLGSINVYKYGLCGREGSPWSHGCSAWSL
jgi:hypothetical protein